MFHNSHLDRPRPTLENRNCFFELECIILVLQLTLNKNSKVQPKSTNILENFSFSFSQNTTTHSYFYIIENVIIT